MFARLERVTRITAIAENSRQTRKTAPEGMAFSVTLMAAAYSPL